MEFIDIFWTLFCIASIVLIAVALRKSVSESLNSFADDVLSRDAELRDMTVTQENPAVPKDG